MSRSGATTSRYSPFQSIWRRSGGANIVSRHLPPGRTSIDTLSRGTSHCGPPYQSAKRSGSVHSLQTRSRGASNTRLIRIPYSLAPSVIAAESLLESPEAGLPEALIGPEPVRCILHRGRAQLRGTQLRRPGARDQAGALENPEMLGHGLNANGQRLGEFAHGCVALAEPRENHPSSRVSEGREGKAEPVGRICIHLIGC